MSAVATKKVGGDYATQLTFPAVFEEQYKKNGLASQFYPEQRTAPVVLSRGSGIQEDYHEQKRIDANRRCLNGVKDTAASTARFLRSHANYIVPKPVLGQRIFANPSNGNQADIYSNRPVFRLSGGVLRTKEGQEYGMRKLKERIPQLDAIDAAKNAFLSGMPVGAMGAEDIGVADLTTKIELYSLLSLVESDVAASEAEPRTVNRGQNALKLLFAFIPIATTQEVEETMAKVESILTALGGTEENYADGQGESLAGFANQKNAEYLLRLFGRMREYLVRMNGVLNRSRKEKEKISAVFIKSLGFTQLEKAIPKLSAVEQRALAVAERNNPNANRDPVPVVDDDEDDEDDFAPVYRQSDSASSFAPSLFAPLPRPDRLEDEPEFDRDNKFDRPRLTEDERQRFGEASGVRDPMEDDLREKPSAEMSEEAAAETMPTFADVSRGKEEALREEVAETRIAMPLAEKAELEKLRASAQADAQELENANAAIAAFPPNLRFLTARSSDLENIADTKRQLLASGYITEFNKSTGEAFRRYIRRSDKLLPRLTILEKKDTLEKKMRRRNELEEKLRSLPRLGRRPQRTVPEISASASASASDSQEVEEPQFFTGLSSSSSGMGKMGKMVKKGKGKVKRDENFFANLLKMLVGKDRNVEH